MCSPRSVIVLSAGLASYSDNQIKSFIYLLNEYLHILISSFEIVGKTLYQKDEYVSSHVEIEHTKDVDIARKCYRNRNRNRKGN